MSFYFKKKLYHSFHSPSDLLDEGDYDDGGVVTLNSPMIEIKNQTAPFISKSKEKNDCGKLHVFILYVLVAICFVIWIVLFFSVLKKNSTLSEELQNLHFNYSDKFVKVMKELDYFKTLQRITQRTIANSITEIEDIIESSCGKVNFSCPINWKTQGKYCYYFSTERETWINALWYCIKQRASLVSIWSDEEQGFLKDSLNGTYWLGMTDLEREGEWRWIEGDWLETITCSMGLRSGLIAGYFRTLQRFVAIHFWVLFDVCLGSLSCWKTQDLGRKPSFLTMGSTLRPKILWWIS